MTQRRTFRGRLIAAGPTRTMLGETGPYVITAAAIRTAIDTGLFRGLACFVDHAAGLPSVRRLLGVWHDVEWDAAASAAVGELVVYETAATRPLVDLLAQWTDDAAANRPVPDLGVSLVFYAEPGSGRTVSGIRMIESADVVMFPASDGARLRQQSAAAAGAGQAGAIRAWASWQNGQINSYSVKSMTRSTQMDNTKNLMKMSMTAEAAALANDPNSRHLAGQGSEGQTAADRQTVADRQTAADRQAAADANWLAAAQAAAASAIIAASGLPAAVQSRLREGQYTSPEEVEMAIGQARGELAALNEAGVVRLGGRPQPAAAAGPGRVIRLSDPLDEAREMVGFFFGAAGAVAPPPNLRQFADLYVALTGDIHFRGVFDGARVQFSGATTTTLPNLAVDAMNRVMVEQFRALDHYRWYERITSVEPNDGRLHDMKWITLGGIGNLPAVNEGAAYTELSVGDVQETAAFTKRGGYVGITREMIKNSDIIQLQAIPRALAAAAVRTRSAAVAALFTANNGVGPTLAQDNKALFHLDHKNIATTALGTDAAAWRAARQECFKHAEVTSGKVLGIFPRYLLVPAELYDTALSILGYGAGMPTTYTPEAQDRGFADPRPLPLVVPDWTDATDWAYIVDPAVYPVVQMSYSQAPGGRVHPVPELFAVVSETSGLMFTNDTLPIKVRDEFAVGVNGPRGLGKRNVA